MPRLVVAYPGVVGVEPGSDAVHVEAKLESGLRHYAARWPGEVVLAARSVPGEGPPGPGILRVERGSASYDVSLAGALPAAVEAARPDLVLVSLTESAPTLGRFLPRSVLVAEFSPEELTRHQLASAAGPLDRLRITVGGGRRARRIERLVRAARGLQANGYPAFDRLGPLSASALLFFDTRLTRDHVTAAVATRRTGPATPARLCFSGRLIAAKGVDHAVAAAGLLADRGVPAGLEVLGAGALEDSLRTGAGDAVRFGGSLPFDPDWTTHVRSEVDVMVLPHVQGDPSGTYLEAAGCGVPVVGFDNVALRSLERRHGLAWTVAMGDTTGLADRIEAVLGDHEGWAAARDRGLEFMAEHHVDAEMDKRVDHLTHLL